MGSKYTARQVHDMAEHLANCNECTDGDDELIASINEGLSPDEMSDAIISAHSPEWKAIERKNKN